MLSRRCVSWASAISLRLMSSVCKSNPILDSFVKGGTAIIKIDGIAQQNSLEIEDFRWFNEKFRVLEREPLVKTVIIKSADKTIFTNGFKSYSILII